MVYCGKPSGGCSNCRLRKIRCDQKEPACGQCEKRNQPCPGYRNLVDLMFRDESSHVINKAAKTRTRPIARRKAQSVGQGPTSASPSPQPVAAGLLSKSSPNFVSEPGSDATSASKTDGSEKLEKPAKAASRRARKSTVRCRAPVLSALTADSSPSASESSHDSRDDGDDTNGLSADHALLGDALSPELQERGTAFFFARYVAADYGWSQNYAFIYDVWKPPDSAEAQVDPITVGMTAVGLVGLSQVTRCPETMTRARQSYAIALKLTYSALRDPVEVAKDTTMLAVLILGTYEFVSGYSPHTMRAWQDHVNGAATLAGMRGTAQFRTKAGIRMFLMLCHTVLISCIQSGLPMPQALRDLRRQIPPSDDFSGPASRVVEPIYKALQVRYDIKMGKLGSLDEIVDALTGADEEFSSILSELPESWKYHRVQMSRPDPRVFGHSCHVYPGLVESTTWNIVRGIRMLVLETLVEQLGCNLDPESLHALSDYHRQTLAKTIKLLDMLGQAIVASVPQHLGVVSFRDVRNREYQEDTVSAPAKKLVCRVRSLSLNQETRSKPSLQMPRGPSLVDPAQSTTQDDNAERFMSLASANHTIVWPLYVLGTSSACSMEAKQYAIERLHVIHQETGLKQARVVAGLLQERTELAPPSRSLLKKLPAVEAGALPSMV
ncbi:negative acting factor [Fusarium albosuccineum]|uniref:Negative acting factor n=1 Tax=Fusarium albosuccineum TaxID=1237068 RepID=A0A8H4KGP1_9HYPO|nr:negative acting factor [Fusarium albosuccineum]